LGREVLKISFIPQSARRTSHDRAMARRPAALAQQAFKILQSIILLTFLPFSLISSTQNRIPKTILQSTICITEDYERAVELFNLCLAKGVQGSNTDFLICAVAERNNCSFFITDKDFQLF
jgi:hypothetical protein